MREASSCSENTTSRAEDTRIERVALQIGERARHSGHQTTLNVSNQLLRVVDRDRRVAVDRDVHGDVGGGEGIAHAHCNRVRTHVGDADGAVSGGARRIQRYAKKHGRVELTGVLLRAQTALEHIRTTSTIDGCPRGAVIRVGRVSPVR